MVTERKQVSETGRRLDEARALRGIGVRELSRKAPVDLSHYYNIRYGKVELGKVVAERLARVLEVSPAWLMGLDDSSPPEPTPEPSLSEEERRALDLYRALDEAGGGLLEAVLSIAGHAAGNPTLHQMVLTFADLVEQFDGRTTARDARKRLLESEPPAKKKAGRTRRQAG